MKVFDYAESDIAYLLKKDQVSLGNRTHMKLKVTQRAGLAFEEFTEPDVKFPPTYKYKKYTSKYDKKEGKKCRAPAWCDRILYHQTARAVPDAIQVESYDHIAKLSGSDHKPVFAVMNMRVKEYDTAKMKKTQLRIERELKKNEVAGAKATIALSTDKIDFGALKYKIPAVRSLTITNTGESNAYFHFLPKAEDYHVSKRMFSLSKVYDVLAPHASVKVAVEALIDADAAHVDVV